MENRPGGRGLELGARNALASKEGFAIVPAPLPPDEELPVAQLVEVDPRVGRWVRVLLVLIAAGLTAVFTTAWRLRPDPRGWGTHQQLGLPPCTFLQLTGIPCPSCGMTTSFSHLAHGDVVGSLKANPVGTLLAVFCLAAVPWCVASAFSGRRIGIRDLESFVARAILVFAVLLLVTWGIRLLTGF